MSWLNGSKPLLALVFPDPLQDAKHDCRPSVSRWPALLLLSSLSSTAIYSDGIILCANPFVVTLM